jgi:hypothetical protein
MTFVVAPEIEAHLGNLKKYIFYNCSQSEMLRALITEGISAIENGVDRYNKQGACARTFDGAVAPYPGSPPLASAVKAHQQG